ncbi:MAG TPA: PIN domain-containing protein [Bosea sp. (in: a-proteobacteria)]
MDANIVISVVLGFRSRPTWERVAKTRRLLVSEEGASEALAVARHHSDRAPAAPADAAVLLETIEIVPIDHYAGSADAAETALRNAPASRNGSTSDAHILALAWTYDADIWSHDRDFAGTGWPSWSNANLAAALADEAPASVAAPER